MDKTIYETRVVKINSKQHYNVTNQQFTQPDQHIMSSMQYDQLVFTILV
jgi:hypothetical protein